VFPQKCCHRVGFFLQLEIFRFCWIGKRYNANLGARIVIELPFSGGTGQNENWRWFKARKASRRR
jgi:hypothetical protein